MEEIIIDEEKLRYDLETALINLKRKLKIENKSFWEFMGNNDLYEMADDEKKTKLVYLCNLLYKR